MRVTKSKLQFLKDYVSIIDTSSPLGDKLKIKVKEGEVIYAQKSSDAFLITKVSSDTKENFELLIQTKMFWDFINTIKDEDELIITEKGIDLGEERHYTFDSFDLSFPNLDDIYKKIEDISDESEPFSFEFKDFDKLQTVQKYMGKDNTETVGFMKDKLLSSDRVQIAYTEANMNLPKNFFFSKPAVDLMISRAKKDSIKVNLTKTFYYFVLDNTYCIFEWKTFLIPDLFSASAYSRFNQSDKVIVNKKDLNSVLTRMSFFVYNNPQNRIFITIKGDHLLIENRDFNKSYEKVDLIERNSDLENVTIIVNNKNLLSFLSNLSGDNVSLFINKDSSQRSTLRLEDPTFKFVHVLLVEDK